LIADGTIFEIKISRKGKEHETESRGPRPDHLSVARSGPGRLVFIPLLRLPW